METRIRPGWRPPSPAPLGGVTLPDTLVRRSVRCWECEAPTAAPATVILGTPVDLIGRLTLCPACYAACDLPLAPCPLDPEAPMHSLLVVEPLAAGRCAVG